MKVEWKGGKLSKKRALFLCWKLWEWLAENPKRSKWHWPGWVNEGGKVVFCWHYCPCCESTSKQCDKCPLSILWGTYKCACEGQRSPFRRWHSSIPSKTRTKYARIIAEAAKAEYIKMGGKV